MAAPDGKMSTRESQRATKLVNAQNKHGESALHHAAIKGLSKDFYTLSTYRN